MSAWGFPEDLHWDITHTPTPGTESALTGIDEQRAGRTHGCCSWMGDVRMVRGQ